MRTSVILTALMMTALSSGSARSADYSTPEGAVAAFDDAYDAFFYPPPYLLICLPIAALP
jgi:hypothetical protein